MTTETVREIYGWPRTGADFPSLVRELKGLGVVSYDHVIGTGDNVFHGKNGEAIALPKMGPACPVSGRADVDALKKIIAEHQRGLSDYPTLCRLVGRVGVEKWVCDLMAMICSYFDKAGNKMHVEVIPVGEYKK